MSKHLDIQTAVLQARADLAAALASIEATKQAALAAKREAEDRLHRLEQERAQLSDDELAGKYRITHGSVGDKQRGDFLTLPGDQARSLLAQGVVEYEGPAV